MIKGIGLAAVVSVVLLAGARYSSLDVAPAAAAQQPGGQPGMADMKKMHEQMMAEMKAADAKLDELVKDMNSAKGDAKTNAIAAVVTELVRQHKAMHEHMGQMHEQMMGGRGMMMKK